MKKIILLDKFNIHGYCCYKILKTNFFSQSISQTEIRWEKIFCFYQLLFKIKKYQNEKDNIFCIPLSWNYSNQKIDKIILREMEKLSKNNIIIASVDVLNPCPWSWNFVIPALQNKKVFFKNKDFEGTSIYACYLALLAARKDKSKFYNTINEDYKIIK